MEHCIEYINYLHATYLLFFSIVQILLLLLLLTLFLTLLIGYNTCIFVYKYYTMQYTHLPIVADEHINRYLQCPTHSHTYTKAAHMIYDY